MRLTKEQSRAVENGQPVRLRKEGLDYVLIRADVYDRVATRSEVGSALIQTRRPDPPVGATASETGKGPAEPAEDLSELWTEEKNDRRCELIDRDLEGTITESEKLELERLQQRFHEYLDTVVPPPLDGAQRLHRELLEKKRRRERWG